MNYTPRRTTFTLKGVFRYTNMDGDSVEIKVNGEYEISTIPNQTVLFKEAGIGPSQIELWDYRGNHPTVVEAIEVVKAGRFWVWR